jgi:iron complex outermembrane receptor protein
MQSLRTFVPSLIAGLICGAVCFAAEASADSDQPVQAERMVVTGSYLPDADEIPANPVVSLRPSQVGPTGAGDSLKLLKSLTPYFSGSGNVGNEVDLFGVGESYVALRNLPTLVLVDGRRVTYSPFSSNTAPAALPAVDLNTIPTGMIERIDVLKDSASALYGSDAVGGVINIVLKKNFTGGEIGVRYGADRHRDYTARDGWAIAGLARSGTSVTAGVEFFKNTKLPTMAREVSSLSTTQLIALGQNPAVLPAHISATYAGRVGNFILAGSPLAAGAPGYNAAIVSPPVRSSPSSPPLSMSDLQGAGYYVPISDTAASKLAGGSASILNTALYNYAVVLPTRRQQAFLSLQHDLAGKRLQVFADAMYARTVNGGTDVAPAPLATPTGLTIPANNPYNVFGVAIGTGGAPNAPGVRTRLDEIGSRSSDNTVTTYRVVAGLRGEINEAWNWESAVNFSRAEGNQTIRGGANGLVLNQLLVPLLDTSGANYVYDAQHRPLSVYQKDGKNVPVFNYFGLPGSNAPETIDAMRATLHREADSALRSIDARVTGRLFEIPAGTVSVALGGELRRETTSSSADQIFNAGLALGFLPVSNLAEQARRTRALFAETRVPLVGPKQSVPLVLKADLSAAVRYEHISPGGNATTPKIGLRWSVFRDLVARGTYQQGFVAPSIFALYGPAQGAVPTVTLPEGNGQTGAGGATGRTVSGQFVGQVLEMSNPALNPATSESVTAGLVYSPRGVHGLELSADYYRIRQNKVGGFDYGFIFADLNARGSASAFAPAFRFTDGTQLVSTTPNQVTSTNAGTLRSVYNPLGDLVTDGLDLSASYAHRLDSGLALEAGIDANVLFNFKARTNPTASYLQYARTFTESTNGKGNPQGLQPGYNLRTHVGAALGRWRGVVRVNYLPAVNAPGTAFGAPTGTPNIFRADLKPYVIPSYTTVDVAVTATLPDFGRRWARKLTLTVGVNDAFDKQAPYVPGGGSGVGSEANTVKSAYDIVGRFVFAELTKQF